MWFFIQISNKSLSVERWGRRRSFFTHLKIHNIPAASHHKYLKRKVDCIWAVFKFKGCRRVLTQWGANGAGDRSRRWSSAAGVHQDRTSWKSHHLLKNPINQLQPKLTGSWHSVALFPLFLVKAQPHQLGHMQEHGLGDETEQEFYHIIINYVHIRPVTVIICQETVTVIRDWELQVDTFLIIFRHLRHLQSVQAC